MTSLQVMVASARSVGWVSNEAVIPVSCTLSKGSDVQYGKTIDSHSRYRSASFTVSHVYEHCVRLSYY